MSLFNGVCCVCFLVFAILLNGATGEINNGTAAHNKTRGMVMCTGSRMVDDARAVIYQTRNVWNSTLAITLAHCGELSWDVQVAMAAKNVTSLDICGGALLASPKRLRGWFCKAAALVMSPYDETLVVDLDTVWFKSPEVIFNSPAYQRTGSLFFRDKTSYAGKRIKAEDRIFQDIIEEFLVAATKGRINMTSSVGLQKRTADGHSFFWRNVANRSEAAINNFQDSSVIALDRSRHPKMLSVLESLIPSFNVGYGDKVRLCLLTLLHIFIYRETSIQKRYAQATCVLELTDIRKTLSAQQRKWTHPMHRVIYAFHSKYPRVFEN